MATTNAKRNGAGNTKPTIHLAEWRGVESAPDSKGRTKVEVWGVAINATTKVSAGDVVIVTKSDGSAFTLAIIADATPVAGKSKTERTKVREGNREWVEVTEYNAYRVSTIDGQREHALALSKALEVYFG